MRFSREVPQRRWITRGDDLLYSTVHWFSRIASDEFTFHGYRYCCTNSRLGITQSDSEKVNSSVHPFLMLPPWQDSERNNQWVTVLDRWLRSNARCNYLTPGAFWRTAIHTAWHGGQLQRWMWILGASWARAVCEPSFLDLGTEWKVSRRAIYLQHRASNPFERRRNRTDYSLHWL